MVVEGLGCVEIEVTATPAGAAELPRGAQPFQQRRAPWAPHTVGLSVRVSAFSLKISSGTFRWCGQLGTLLLLIETS